MTIELYGHSGSKATALEISRKPTSKALDQRPTMTALSTRPPCAVIATVTDLQFGPNIPVESKLKNIPEMSTKDKQTEMFSAATENLSFTQ